MKPLQYLLSLLPIMAFIFPSLAQNDTSRTPFQLSAYLETYYIYDMANPDDQVRPGFLYSFNRHNEVNLNIGFIQAAYEQNGVRAKLALMTGTYANANLAHEPATLKNIFEANAGFRLSRSKDIWVDAGIFSSHIGFESAIGALTWNMTRSIVAENSPYYVSGAKISYTSDNDRWFVAGLVLNGWQRITRVQGNQLPAFGHQITYTPNSKVTLNSSSFIGNDYPESERRMRYYHNFYGQFKLSEALGLITGFDIGAEQRLPGSDLYYIWYTPVVIARYTPSARAAIAARAEYYSDRYQVVIDHGSPLPFQTFGYSVNFDLTIQDNLLWRIEARRFSAMQAIFRRDELSSRHNFFAGTSLAFTFR